MSSHVHPISRKRKERELPAAVDGKLLTAAGSPAPSGNRLLAGYMAHEFLSKGTLFGKQWPPERPDPNSASNQTGRVADRPATSNQAPTAYDEVAYLLKTDGVHIPGVVNPTQLARWLQM